MKGASAKFVLVAALLAACGPSKGVISETAGAPLRVGIVTVVTGSNDAGYNALADLGRLDAERDLGVRTSLAESNSPDDYARGIADFAEDGYDLVIAVGVPLENATWRVAKQFPTVRFAIVDGAPEDDKSGTENLPNVANLLFAENEAGYLVGVIAATMAHDRVGSAIHDAVCSMGDIAVPRTDRFIAGYQHAVNAVSPTTRILNGYSNDLADPQKATEIGLDHIAQGCDILFQVAAGNGYTEAAGRKGVYALGIDWDRSASTPGTVIASAVKRVDRAVYATVKDLREGRFKAGDNLFDASKDGIGYGTLAPIVPASARAAADQALADIKSGRIKPKADLQAR
ncbi:MAG: BMP family ABC transporter substrate-binding protein [Chloroflexota bacterium]|nr:BMP family ABC transporter substrate-binding protein [Chloroflexota bacterium]